MEADGEPGSGVVKQWRLEVWRLGALTRRLPEVAVVSALYINWVVAAFQCHNDPRM